VSRSHVLQIARWEFLRYFKVRDLVIMVVLAAALGGASWLFSWWQERSSPTARVAVIAPVPVSSPDAELRLEPRVPGDLPALREQVLAEQLDGVLVIDPPAARVIARDEPSWLDHANAAATQALQSARLAELGVTADQLAALLAPARVQLDLLRGETRSGSAKVTARLILGVMLATLMIGISYLFMAITGEKQNRVTEQVFVMTSAQALIDGKLIAHGLLALSLTVQTAVLGGIGVELFTGGLIDWLVRNVRGVGAGELALLLAYAVLGFAFWFALLAAWFATINDPHSSARTNALLVPTLPVAAVVLGMSSPDSAMMKTLAIVPLTSMTVMPVRLVVTDVGAIEIAISLALLLAATLWLRRAAARIYEVAMLMFGKEPSLREMMRWLRHRPADEQGGTPRSE
jgi:ABC-2 type transport system permease protein